MRRPANRALLLCVLLDDGQNVRHVVFSSAFRSCHWRRRSPFLTYLNGGYRRSSLLYASASSVGIHRKTPCRSSSERERLHGWSQLVHRDRYVVRCRLIPTSAFLLQMMIGVRPSWKSAAIFSRPPNDISFCCAI